MPEINENAGINIELFKNNTSSSSKEIFESLNSVVSYATVERFL
jgi:hypothetical protein